MSGAVKARKHEAILSAATRVFVREGFDGASMEQVAREAKVAKPTLYNHFPDKGALYVTVVENALKNVNNEIAKPRLAELPARQGLLVVANQLTDLFGRHDSAVHLCRIAVGGGRTLPTRDGDDYGRRSAPRDGKDQGASARMVRTWRTDRG